MNDPGLTWRISGHDVAILEQLRTALRLWLPAFEAAQDVISIGAAMNDIEQLEKSGRAPGNYEINLEATNDDEQGGFSLRVFIANDKISLGLLEITAGPVGMRDCLPVLTPDEEPIALNLTSMGSFDQSIFAYWFEHAVDWAPHPDSGPNVKAFVKDENP